MLTGLLNKFCTVQIVCVRAAHSPCDSVFVSSMTWKALGFYCSLKMSFVSLDTRSHFTDAWGGICKSEAYYPLLYFTERHLLFVAIHSIFIDAYTMHYPSGVMVYEGRSALPD